MESCEPQNTEPYLPLFAADSHSTSAHKIKKRKEKKDWEVSISFLKVNIESQEKRKILNFSNTAGKVCSGGAGEKKFN